MEQKRTTPEFIMELIVLALICLTFFPLCSNGDNAAQKNDTPIRIGIAWRGDSTSISYTSALQSVREAGAIAVPLPLLKSPFMKYEGDELLAQYIDEHGFFLGLQYHPEVAVAKHANGAADASRFMDYDSALCYFRALIKHNQTTKQQ